MRVSQAATVSIKRLLGTLGLEVTRTNTVRYDVSRVSLRGYVESVCAEDPATMRFLQFCLENFTRSKSQNFQDLFVDFVLDTTGGFFVEFGATDGVNLSNTHYLQYSRGWNGLLAEPATRWHEALAENRPEATIDHRCVWKASGEQLVFRETAVGDLSTIDAFAGSDSHASVRKQEHRTYLVETVSLNDLLEAHGVDEHFDYLSVDTEGSEYEILSQFDFSRHRPRVLTVEHNFSRHRDGLFRLLTGEGYERVFSSLSAFDDWYVDSGTWRSFEDRLARLA